MKSASQKTNLTTLLSVCVAASYALIAVAPSATASAPEVILSPLGAAAGNEFGSAAACAGDVNGDGFADFVVGAYLNDDPVANAGSAYVYFGGPGSDEIADLTLHGLESGEFFGASLGGDIDINGDGFSDIVVGAWGGDGGGTDSGGAYVFYGGPGADSVPDIAIVGAEQEDYLGASVSGIGDFDGDGYDDFIVGSTKSDHFSMNFGAAFIYLGGPAADNVADLILGGPSGFFGIAVSGAGDVNGDGYDDVIVGARYNGGGNAGAAFVYYGGPGADNVADLTLNGQSGEWFGDSVSGGGDINGDGYDDLLVGAPNSNLDGTNAGRAYAYFGGPGADGIADLILLGDFEKRLGSSVSIAGDLDGDGFDDLIAGAPLGIGTTYVYRGGVSPDNIPDAALYGTALDDDFGMSVSGVGDLNGNGLHEFIVGAPSNSDGGSGAGRAYVFATSNFEVLSPNGAEQWVVGQAGTVRWNGFSTVDLSLSLDGGMSWSTWASVSSNGESNSATLIAPAVTEVALVRVSAPGQPSTQSNSDVSDAVFRIVAPFDPPAATTVQTSLVGGPGNEAFGIDISSCGDFNDDGHPDVIVGASIADVVGSREGKAYVFFGGPDWDGTADLEFAGSNDNDRLGRDVSHADVNGDGIDDALVGVPWDDTAANNAGVVKVFFGGASPDAIADLTFLGQASGDEFGNQVAGAGDINGDGIEDFIVGAQYSDVGGTNSGQAYVYYGSFWSNTSADLTFSGASNNARLGHDVAGAGDVNADGYDDLIVGTSNGTAYVYFGGPNADDTADLILAEGESNDWFGRSVDGGDDVNGDGFDDFVVGAYGDDTGATGAGRIYLYFGGPSVDNVPDVYLDGNHVGHDVGHHVALIGDVNDDGFADIASGSPGDYVLGDETGQVQVFFGSPAPDSTPDVIFSTTAESEFLGTSVAAAGDINADGFPDLLIGTELEFAHVHNFSRYHLTRPTEGQNWSVGATERITWTGAEPADVWLSIDGGNGYELLDSGVGGHSTNEIAILVPHRPGRFSRIKLTPNQTGISGSAVSDSLFTIEASIALLRMRAGPADDGGVLLTWETDPGPADLAGYKLDRSSIGSDDWSPLTSLIRTNEYHDVTGAPGMRYRLIGVNGLGEELVLGETAHASRAALSAWPLPHQGGNLNVSFAIHGRLGDASGRATVTVFDPQGRRVRTIADDTYDAGYQATTWDGRDEAGYLVPSGVYFLRVASGGESSQMRLIVVR